LSGRTLALQGLGRLSSPDPYPESTVHHYDPEFPPLARLVLWRTPNYEVREMAELGLQLYQMTPMYGDRLTTEVPEAWPESEFVPQTAPVAIMFLHPAPPDPEEPLLLTWAGTLEDIRNWIEEERDHERFVVTAVIIGSLSVYVGLREVLGPLVSAMRTRLSKSTE